MSSKIRTQDEDANNIFFHIYELQIEEEYEDIIKKIIFKCPLIIFLFDLTNQNSFEKLKFVIKIINSIDKKEKIIKLLVGNKLDKEELREVSGFEAQTLVDNYSSFQKYIEISLKTKENVNLLISLIINDFNSSLDKKVEIPFIDNNEDHNFLIYDQTNIKIWNNNNIIPNFKTAPILYNIILLGEKNVGKSTFISSLIDDKGEENKTKNYSNILNECHLYIKINSNEIKTNLLDTAGLDKYSSITKNYYQQADGIIILFDVTNKDTLSNADKWFKEVKKYTNDDIPIYLVGNKIDLFYNREVTQDNGNDFAKEKNVKYFEVSCKYKINIDEVINTFIWNIYNIETEEIKGYSLDSIGLSCHLKNKKKCC